MIETTFVQPGIYRHWKGGFYVVEEDCLMVNSMDDTKQELWIRYWSCAKRRWYCRPVDHFLGMTHEEGQKRFEWIGFNAGA